MLLGETRATLGESKARQFPEFLDDIFNDGQNFGIVRNLLYIIQYRYHIITTIGEESRIELAAYGTDDKYLYTFIYYFNYLRTVYNTLSIHR